MINYVKGNLFESSAEILAHGCNCIGGFNSGVAKGFSIHYPESRKQYLHKYNTVGWKLGDVQFVNTKDKLIANCATQFRYGREPLVYIDYDAIKVVMKKLYDYSKQNNKTIAIPKIGAGLGGGDWLIIEKIINDIFTDKEILVYFL